MPPMSSPSMICWLKLCSRPGSMLAQTMRTLVSRSSRLCSCHRPSAWQISWTAIPSVSQPAPSEMSCMAAAHADLRPAAVELLERDPVGKLGSVARGTFDEADPGVDAEMFDRLVDDVPERLDDGVGNEPVGPAEAQSRDADTVDDLARTGGDGEAAHGIRRLASDRLRDRPHLLFGAERDVALEDRHAADLVVDHGLQGELLDTADITLTDVVGRTEPTGFVARGVGVGRRGGSHRAGVSSLLGVVFRCLPWPLLPGHKGRSWSTRDPPREIAWIGFLNHLFLCTE